MRSRDIVPTSVCRVWGYVWCPRIHHTYGVPGFTVGEIRESGIQCGRIKTPGQAEHHLPLRCVFGFHHLTNLDPIEFGPFLSWSSGSEC